LKVFAMLLLRAAIALRSQLFDPLDQIGTSRDRAGSGIIER
jgi:hypothetical protein